MSDYLRIIYGFLLLLYKQSSKLQTANNQDCKVQTSKLQTINQTANAEESVVGFLSEGLFCPYWNWKKKCFSEQAAIIDEFVDWAVFLNFKKVQNIFYLII